MPALSKKITSSPFDKRVQQIATEFSNLAKESDEICATKLADLLARINELSLILEDSETLVSLDSLTKLKNLQQQVRNEGEKLFTRLVIKGEFKVAEQMPSFYYLLENYLEMALLTRNHRLLDFILQHGGININNQEVTVKGAVYPSAVHYCLSCGIRENPMADCLSVLIRHGASLFGSDESGLPIAHTILSTDNHPLKKAFTANRDKTIDSIAFYRQLISTLKLYLAEHPSSSTDGSIEKAIEYYQTHIEGLRIRRITPSERKLKSQIDAFLDKHDTDDIIERVCRDKDVIALQKIVQQAQTAFHKQLDYKQRMAFAKADSQKLTNLDKTLKHHGDKVDDFEELKRLAIAYLENHSVLIAKYSELAALQKKRGPHNPRMLNKQKLLRDEIAEMENKYAVKNVEKRKNLDANRQLAETLDQIEDSFNSFMQPGSLTLSDFNPESGKDETELSEEIALVTSNLNTIFNMFAPLRKSGGRETDRVNVLTKRDSPLTNNPEEQGPR